MNFINSTKPDASRFGAALGVMLAIGILGTSDASAPMASDREVDQMKPMAIDRAKILSDPGVFGIVASFKLRPDWSKLEPAERQTATMEVKKLIDDNKDKVLVDTYLTRGLKASSDFFLRVNAYDLANIQNFLVNFRATTLGRHSDEIDSAVGITKPRTYITSTNSPDLDACLTSTTCSEQPLRFTIVIPIKKSAQWWNLSFEQRRKEMETHTQRILDFLSKTNYKLYYKIYHSSGLDDMDFITYFETNDLMAFHKLVISLLSIPENKYNVRFGNPTMLGTLQKPDNPLEALLK